jgi:hypothetical protein
VPHADQRTALSIEDFFNSWCDVLVNDVRKSPLLTSLDNGGAFASTLRERVNQARSLLVREQAEVVDDIGVQAAQSRLAYLLQVATEQGIDVDHPPRRFHGAVHPQHS